MARSHNWLTVEESAARINETRWSVLMLSLHGELKYRPTRNGIEVRADSVTRYLASATTEQRKTFTGTSD